jgi:hypothetical protein
VRKIRDLDSQRAFVDLQASKLGLKVPDDLPKLTSTYMRDNGGSWLLRIYNDSIAKLLDALYPQLKLKEEPWRYPEIIQRSWIKDISTRRKFMDFASQKLGLSDPTEWLQKSPRDLLQFGGHTINRSFGESWIHFLKETYPEVSWPPSERTSLQRNGFDATPRQIFEQSMKRLGLSLLDMYEIQLPALQSEAKLQNMIRYKFHSSISGAVVSAFPEHAWEIHRFKEMPSEPLLRLNLLSRLIKDVLAPRLHISALEDWYRVSRRDVYKVSRRRFKEFESRLSMCNLLVQTYPEHTWELAKFGALNSALQPTNFPRRRTSQRLMSAIIRSALGDGVQVLEDFLHPTLNLRFDVFVPEKQLAFEYQGEQHFKDTYKLGDSKKSGKWDEGKAAACFKAGITLLDFRHDDEITVERVLAQINGRR